MRLKTTAVLALTLFATAACTRRVQVESEPNQPNYMQSTAVEIAGTYDYVVMTDDGPVEQGPLTVTRTGDTYGVRFGLTQSGGEVVGRNVRREGDTLAMEADTPAGAGTIELTWQGPNEITGVVFAGETLSVRATRRP